MFEACCSTACVVSAGGFAVVLLVWPFGISVGALRTRSRETTVTAPKECQ
jgi:hypothetical protein